MSCKKWKNQIDKIVYVDSLGDWFLIDTKNHRAEEIFYCPFCGNLVMSEGCIKNHSNKEGG